MGPDLNSVKGLPTKQPYGLSRARFRYGSDPAHGRHIKRVTAAQNILWFALTPPIHRESGLVPTRDSQFLAGSGQGRMTSSFKAM